MMTTLGIGRMMDEDTLTLDPVLFLQLWKDFIHNGLESAIVTDPKHVRDEDTSRMIEQNIQYSIAWMWAEIYFAVRTHCKAFGDFEKKARFADWFGAHNK